MDHTCKLVPSAVYIPKILDSVPNRTCLTNMRPSYTNYLLDLLKAKKAKATFFVNGLNWGPDIMVYDNRNRINRMRYEGHQIGSHTYNHADLSTLSYADVQSQMTALEAPLKSILGKYPTYMRPPYLSCGNNCPAALDN